MATSASENKTDIPIVIMGLLFLSLSLFEYFVPAGSEGDRAAVKILCGAQIVFGLFFSLTDRRSRAPIFRNYLHNALLLLFVWLCGAGLIGASDLRVVLSGCIMFIYWYSMFVFFYVRSAGSPNKPELFLLIVAASVFVWVSALRGSVSVQMDIAGREEQFQIQNYIGYYIIALVPFVLMLRRKLLKVIALALISYAAIYSLKRGVMLALVLIALSATFVYLTFVCTAQERRRGLIAVFVVWFLAMSAASSFYLINREAVDRRFDMNRGREREEVYSATISRIMKSDIFEVTVGHGYLQSLEDIGTRTHNDWLFLQYDYGFVGVLLMANVYLALIALLWRLCKAGSPLSVSLACSIVLMFCVQMYSVGLYLKIFGFILAAIGLVAGASAAQQGSTPASQMQRA